MDEFLYLTGSVSAIVLLLGHVGWGLARLFRTVGSQRQHKLSEAQFDRLQQDMSAQLDSMRVELGSALEDVHDRLDFAERVLSKGREKGPKDG